MKERRYRSLMKGISWRIVGTLDTIFLSWVFTGAMSQALTIGGLEFFTKIGLYYLHERTWLRLAWGRRVIGESGAIAEERKRSVVKGLSWRITGTIDTTLIAFLVIGQPIKALSVGFTEVITKVGLYYLHERLWHRIDLGRDHGKWVD